MNMFQDVSELFVRPTDNDGWKKTCQCARLDKTCSWADFSNGPFNYMYAQTFPATQRFPGVGKQVLSVVA